MATAVLSCITWAWAHPLDVVAWVLLLWALAVVIGSAVLWVLLLRSEQRRERDRLNRIMAACGDPGPKHRKVS